MIKLKDYTSALIENDGIYFANERSTISYPDSGNNDCYQIEEDSFWFNHRNNCIVEAVKRNCPKKIFFDIGGGNGFVSKALIENNIESVLVEPGIQGCLNAKQRHVNTIICATLEDAEFKKSSMEAVGLFDVVEHIEKDEDFLKTIFSLLTSDGYIFITVPAYSWLWSNEDVDAGHFRRYTTKQFEKKLENVGFEIVQSTYIFSILPFFVSLFRTVPSKLGLNRKSNNLNKHVNEHKQRNGLAQKAMNAIWSCEVERIRQGKRIPFGGSCFIVAKKM